MIFKNITFVFILLFISACSTTEQLLLHTKDQIGTYHSDAFINIKYSYTDGSYIVICTDAFRQQRNIFDDKHHLIKITYEFNVLISDLENIKQPSKPAFHIQDIYRIPRENIRDCDFETRPNNYNRFEIKNVTMHQLRAQKSQNTYGNFNQNRISIQGSHGDLLMADGRYLLYISKGPNLIRIQTEKPITPGIPALYLLAPFTLIYDIVAFPFRALYILAIAMGH